MLSRLLLSTLAAAMLACAAPAAYAADPTPSPAAMGDQETADWQVVRAASSALNRKGVAGLKPYLADLETILGRAPASYPVRETTGRTVIVRMNDSGDAAVASMGGLLTGSNQAVLQPNVYGQAAFLLGWAAVDRKDSAAAIAYLDRGLAFQPDNAELLGERGVALTMQRRWAESLATYERGLALDSLLVPAGTRATLLRGKGFALIELGRLDEAEVAYRASLEIVPNHGGALNELTYIDQLRRGGKSIESNVFTAKEAATMGQDDHKSGK